MKKRIMMFLWMLAVPVLLVGLDINVSADTEDYYTVIRTGLSHGLVPNSVCSLSVSVFREYYDEINEENCSEEIPANEISDVKYTLDEESKQYANINDKGILSIKGDIPQSEFVSDECGGYYIPLQLSVSFVVDGETMNFSNGLSVHSRDFEYYADKTNKNWSVVMEKGEVVTLHPYLVLYDADHPDGIEVENAHFYVSLPDEKYENETFNYYDLKIKIDDSELVIGAKGNGSFLLDFLGVYLIDENGEKDRLPEIFSTMNPMLTIIVRSNTTPALTADATGIVNVPEDIGIFTFTPHETEDYIFPLVKIVDEDEGYSYVNISCYDDVGSWIGDKTYYWTESGETHVYSLVEGITYTFFYNYRGDDEPLGDINLSADGNDMTTSPTQPMLPTPSIKAPITSTTTTSPSAATIKTTIAKVKNLKARSRTKKKAVITWKKMSGVTGYQIQYSLKKTFKSKKTITIKKASTKKVTLKKLKSGKKYYVRIRAYKKVGSENNYGKWSTVAKVKVK